MTCWVTVGVCSFSILVHHMAYHMQVLLTVHGLHPLGAKSPLVPCPKEVVHTGHYGQVGVGCVRHGDPNGAADNLQSCG